MGAESPGQLAMTWVLTSPEGARYCLVMILAARDNTTLPSPLWLQAVARQVIDRLPIWIAAKEPKLAPLPLLQPQTPPPRPRRLRPVRARPRRAPDALARVLRRPRPPQVAPPRLALIRPRPVRVKADGAGLRVSCHVPHVPPTAAPMGARPARAGAGCCGGLAVGCPPQGRYRARPWASFSVNAYKFGYNPRSTASAINTPKKVNVHIVDITKVKLAKGPYTRLA